MHTENRKKKTKIQIPKTTHYITWMWCARALACKCLFYFWYLARWIFDMKKAHAEPLRQIDWTDIPHICRRYPQGFCVVLISCMNTFLHINSASERLYENSLKNAKLLVLRQASFRGIKWAFLSICIHVSFVIHAVTVHNSWNILAQQRRRLQFAHMCHNLNTLKMKQTRIQFYLSCVRSLPDPLSPRLSLW